MRVILAISLALRVSLRKLAVILGMDEFCRRAVRGNREQRDESHPSIGYKFCIVGDDSMLLARLSIVSYLEWFFLWVLERICCVLHIRDGWLRIVHLSCAHVLASIFAREDHGELHVQGNDTYM